MFPAAGFSRPTTSPAGASRSSACTSSPGRRAIVSAPWSWCGAWSPATCARRERCGTTSGSTPRRGWRRVAMPTARFPGMRRGTGMPGGMSAELPSRWGLSQNLRDPGSHGRVAGPAAATGRSHGPGMDDRYHVLDAHQHGRRHSYSGMRGRTHNIAMTMTRGILGAARALPDHPHAGQWRTWAMETFDRSYNRLSPEDASNYESDWFHSILTMIDILGKGEDAYHLAYHRSYFEHFREMVTPPGAWSATAIPPTWATPPSCRSWRRARRCSATAPTRTPRTVTSGRSPPCRRRRGQASWSRCAGSTPTGGPMTRSCLTRCSRERPSPREPRSCCAADDLRRRPIWRSARWMAAVTGTSMRPRSRTCRWPIARCCRTAGTTGSTPSITTACCGERALLRAAARLLPADHQALAPERGRQDQRLRRRGVARGRGG